MAEIENESKGVGRQYWVNFYSNRLLQVSNEKLDLMQTSQAYEKQKKEDINHAQDEMKEVITQFHTTMTMQKEFDRSVNPNYKKMRETLKYPS